MTQSTYQLIDSGSFRKLEEVGGFRIVRPSPQAVWRPRLDESEWKKADAEYVRFSGGTGEWRIKNKKLPQEWMITVEGLPFTIRPTDFGHLGIFAEQASNWQKLQTQIAQWTKTQKDFQVLNLFGYTGGSTLAAARGGAKVVHVDASKTSVAWARVNADKIDPNLAVRWIIDDAQKFVAREVRRESRYHGVILDPPSYGRGAKNEVWKIEEHLVLLLSDLKKIMADDFRFILLSAHSDGYTPIAMRNLLADLFGEKGMRFDLGEMLIPEATTGRALPSGNYCWLIRD